MYSATNLPLRVTIPIAGKRRSPTARLSAFIVSLVSGFVLVSMILGVGTYYMNSPSKPNGGDIRLYKEAAAAEAKKLLPKSAKLTTGLKAGTVKKHSTVESESEETSESSDEGKSSVDFVGNNQPFDLPKCDASVIQTYPRYAEFLASMTEQIRERGITVSLDDMFKVADGTLSPADAGYTFASFKYEHEQVYIVFLEAFLEKDWAVTINAQFDGQEGFLAGGLVIDGALVALHRFNLAPQPVNPCAGGRLFNTSGNMAGNQAALVKERKPWFTIPNIVSAFQIFVIVLVLAASGGMFDPAFWTSLYEDVCQKASSAYEYLSTIDIKAMFESVTGFISEVFDSIYHDHLVPLCSYFKRLFQYWLGRVDEDLLEPAV